MPETILIVDDEEPVRRTFRDWLDTSGLACQVLTAATPRRRWCWPTSRPSTWPSSTGTSAPATTACKLLEDLYVFQPRRDRPS